MGPCELPEGRGSASVANRRTPALLLAVYLSAHRTMTNGSALCAAWLSPSVTTLLA
jgi:hypothetical protein